MSYRDDDSEKTPSLEVLRMYVRQLRECNEEYEERIRKLEDYNLEQRARHKQLIWWLTIACSAMSGTVDIAIHILKGYIK